MAAKLRNTEYAELLELRTEWAARPADLLEAVGRHRPNVVHFSGHVHCASEVILTGSISLPQPVNPEEGFLDISQGIQRLVNELRNPS